MKRFLLKTFIVLAVCSVLTALLLTPPNQLSKGIPFTFAQVTSDENAVSFYIAKRICLLKMMWNL